MRVACIQFETMSTPDHSPLMALVSLGVSVGNFIYSPESREYRVQSLENRVFHFHFVDLVGAYGAGVSKKTKEFWVNKSVYVQQMNRLYVRYGSNGWIVSPDTSNKCNTVKEALEYLQTIEDELKPSAWLGHTSDFIALHSWAARLSISVPYYRKFIELRSFESAIDPEGTSSEEYESHDPRPRNIPQQEPRWLIRRLAHNLSCMKSAGSFFWGRDVIQGFDKRDSEDRRQKEKAAAAAVETPLIKPKCPPLPDSFAFWSNMFKLLDMRGKCNKTECPFNTQGNGPFDRG